MCLNTCASAVLMELLYKRGIFSSDSSSLKGKSEPNHVQSFERKAVAAHLQETGRSASQNQVEALSKVLNEQDLKYISILSIYLLACSSYCAHRTIED